MEPKNFWKEMQRLCKQRGGTCDDSECGYDCPLCALPCCADRKTMASVTATDFAEMYTAVEKWSNANPAKTRQSEFLKAYPDVKINTDTGAIAIFPCVINKKLTGEHCKKYSQRTDECDACAWDWWTEEIE